MRITVSVSFLISLFIDETKGNKNVRLVTKYKTIAIFAT